MFSVHRPARSDRRTTSYARSRLIEARQTYTLDNMDTVFTAFVAHSFADHNQPHFRLFTSLLQAFGFQLDVYDYQEVEGLSAAIRDRIASADCVVAIASVTQAGPDGAKWMSEWVRQEIAAAVALQKPMILLAEDGLQRPPFAERAQTFHRDRLLESVAPTVRYMISLKTQLQVKTGQSVSSGIEYIRPLLHVRDTFVDSERLTRRILVEQESLVNGLKAWSHLWFCEDATQGVSVKSRDLKVELQSAPAGIELLHELIQNTDAQVRVRIATSRGLMIGERIVYSLKNDHDNPQPFTKAELYRRIADGTYRYKEAFCDACDWMIIAPTRELIYEAEWPSGYELEDITAVVQNKDDWTVDHDETRRLEAQKCLRTERMFDKQYVRLHVMNPLYARLYKVRYRPKS